MGRTLGDPADPLLVSVRSGAKFSMPGMMDTVLNLGLNDEQRRRASPQSTGDERFAYDSYRRFISMYGRIVLDIDGEHVRHAARDGQGGGRRRRPTPSIAAEALDDAVRATTRTSSRRETGKPFPQDPTEQLRGAIEAVFRSWNGARAIAYRVRERISHDLGTAVNVQAMVFGNRDDNSRHRRRLHPQRGHRREQAVRRLPRQRPGRRRRRRHPQHRGPRRAEAPLPGDPRRAARHLRPPRAALPRHVRHRVHHRAGQALDAADPRRQAHRRGRAAHGRRHDARTGKGKAAGRSRKHEAVHARHRRPPRPGAAPAVRRQAGKVHRQGPGRVAGRGRRQGVLHRRRRRRRRRARRGGHPRAQRDQPRGRARHDGRPRASSPPAAGSSATPPSSPAAGARRPSSAPRR